MTLSPEQFLTILNNTKCVVIKFSARWCGPCKNKVFLEEYYNMKKILVDINDVIFFEFDVDTDEHLINEKTLYNFNISAVPTIKVFCDGTQLAEHKGIATIDKVISNIHKILNF